MNDSQQTSAMNLIDEHLDAVEAVLAKSGLTRPERRRVIDELEVQIHDMLAARGENPTDADVREIVSQLDPPEAYAGSNVPAAQSAISPASDVEPKYSKLAIFGALWASLFFATSILFFTSVKTVHHGEIVQVTSWVYLARFISVIGLMAPFGTTILGWVAVSQIRHSRGRVYGLGLALFDGLVFPIMLLDGLIAFFGYILFSIFFDDIWQSFNQPILLGVFLPLIIATWYVLDRLVIMDCLRRVRKQI